MEERLERFEQILSDMLGEQNKEVETQTETYPQVNRIKTTNGTIFEINLAGYNKDLLNIDIVENDIIVVGTEAPLSVDDEAYRVFDVHPFDLTLECNGFDMSTAFSSYSDGILTVGISRVEEPVQKKTKLEIK